MPQRLVIEQPSTQVTRIPAAAINGIRQVEHADQASEIVGCLANDEGWTRGREFASDGWIDGPLPLQKVASEQGLGAR